MNTITKMTRWSPWIITTCAATLVLSAVGVQAAKSAQMQLKIDRVALFKNGLGYFTSSATLPPGATTVEIGQLPVASQGTFWVGYPKEVQVRSLITRMEDITQPRPIHNVADLVRANPGRQVTLTTRLEGMPTVIGTIVEVATEQPPATPSPYWMAPRPSPSARHYPHYGGNPPVLIRTEQGVVALDAASITRADFAEKDVITTASVTAKQPSLRLELQQPAGGKQLGVSYLARGITWSPSYLIDLSDPQTARLSAKAVVVNEVADLDEVQLELVTGFPHARLAEVSSPVSMSQDLSGFLKALVKGRSESSADSYLTQQRAEYAHDRTAGRSNAPMPEYSTAHEGTAAEDLFLYPVDRFSLRRGETACVPLFSVETPYKHIYTWSIPDLIDERNPYHSHNDQQKGPPTDEVWHCCRLKNNMEMPWTTAAAEFVSDGKFVGQDICHYTVPGAKTTVRINRAMNIHAEQAELELDRKRGAANFYGYNHDLVTVRGELALDNYSKQPVEVEVSKLLSGEVQETSPAAEDIPTAKGLQAVNPRHKLVWKVQMKPGEKQKLSYRFKVYVRR